MFNKIQCSGCKDRNAEIDKLNAKIKELTIENKSLQIALGLVIQTANQDATNSVYEMDEMENSKLKYAREKGVLHMANKILHLLGQPMIGLKKDGDKFARKAEDLIKAIALGRNNNKHKRTRKIR